MSAERSYAVSLRTQSHKRKQVQAISAACSVILLKEYVENLYEPPPLCAWGDSQDAVAEIAELNRELARSTALRLAFPARRRTMLPDERSEAKRGVPHPRMTQRQTSARSPFAKWNQKSEKRFRVSQFYLLLSSFVFD